MNKLLSSKMLALSVLALFASESCGMNQPIQVMIPGHLWTSGNVWSKKSGFDYSNSNSYRWFKKIGMTSLAAMRKCTQALLKSIQSPGEPPLISRTDWQTKSGICRCLDNDWEIFEPLTHFVQIVVVPDQSITHSNDTVVPQPEQDNQQAQTQEDLRENSQQNPPNFVNRHSVASESVRINPWKIPPKLWHRPEFQKNYQSTQSQPQQTLKTSISSETVHDGNDGFFFGNQLENYPSGYESHEGIFSDF